jgi:tellurite resistance protein
MKNTSRLQFFPAALFGTVLGFSGLSTAFMNATKIFDLNPIITLVLTILTTLILLIIFTIYLLKTIKYPTVVIFEISHPVVMNFFPAFTISLIILSVLYIPINESLASWIFYIGASGHIVLTFYIMQTWLLHDKWQIQQMSPAWFIPIVGNFAAPIAAVNFAPIELSWYFFSIGLVFWLVLQAIIMYRLFFHPPMLKVLEPTLFILIAPPAIGFISYVSLHPNQPIDDFARILYYTALFFTLLLAGQIIRFIKIPFALSWWAYTFPLSAIASASFIMYEKLKIELFFFVGALILSILSALVLHLTIKTILAIKHKKLCVPLEH